VCILPTLSSFIFPAPVLYIDPTTRGAVSATTQLWKNNNNNNQELFSSSRTRFWTVHQIAMARDWIIIARLEISK
jgi:hypothetical protein